MHQIILIFDVYEYCSSSWRVRSTRYFYSLGINIYSFGAKLASRNLQSTLNSKFCNATSLFACTIYGVSFSAIFHALALASLSPLKNFRQITLSIRRK